MKQALFTGCIIPIQNPFIERIARDIFPKIGVEINDLEFSCCPFYGVRDIDEKEWLVIAARNLSLAEEKSLEIVSLCNGCTQTLKEANEMLRNNELREEINTSLARINRHYNGTVKVTHFMMLLDNIKDKLRPMIKPLRGLRIATHTGCHLLRPSGIMGYDNPENPARFNEFIRFLGAQAVEYNSSSLCCGYSQITNDKDASLSIMKDKLDELSKLDIDCLSVCCPSCFNQFDKNQVLLKSKYTIDYKIPVLHVLQLLGISMGMSPEQVFIQNNRTISPELKEKLSQI